jgi:HSP20 family protein
MFNRFRFFNDPLFHEMDRLLPRLLTSYGGAGDGAMLGDSIGCPVNVSEDQNTYYIQALVPGLTAEQLELNWRTGTLTIHGEVAAQPPEGATVVWSEIQPYQFHRAVQLSDAVDSDNVEARLENGVLMIIAPKAEHAKARRIEIGGTTPRQINAGKP